MSVSLNNLSTLFACTCVAMFCCGPQASDAAIDANKVGRLQVTSDGGVLPVVVAGREDNASVPDSEGLGVTTELGIGVLEALLGEFTLPESLGNVFGPTDDAAVDQGFREAFDQAFRFFVLEDGTIIENEFSQDGPPKVLPLGGDDQDKALEAILDGIPSGGIKDLDDQSLLELALLLGQNFGDKQLAGESEVRKRRIDRLKREVVKEFNDRKRRQFARRFRNALGGASDQEALQRAAQAQQAINNRKGIATGLFGLGHNANQNGVDGLGPEVDNFDVLKNDSYVNAATIPQTPAGGGQTFFGPFILNPGVNGASINVNDVIYNFYFNGTNIVTVP